MRGSAYALREEVRAARFRAQQNEAGRLPEEQKLRHAEAKASMHKRDPTSNLAARSEVRMEGHRERIFAREAPSKKGGQGDDSQPQAEATVCGEPNEMEVEECIQKTGNDTLRVMTKETTGLNVEVGVDIVHNKGRGDPTSTMLWSPRKHAGHKKPLESEEEESDDEIMAKDARTSDDDQEVEALGTENQQHHKDESEWQVEEEYTDLGEEHRIQAGVESDSGRELGGQTSKLGLYVGKGGVYRHSKWHLR